MSDAGQATAARRSRFAVHRDHASIGACCAALLAVNLLVAAPLLRLDYGPYMGSMEGSFIALARYIREHWPDLSWFPLWHSGMPLSNVYPPGLHFAVAGLASLLHTGDARAYHLATTLLYAAGPVTVFLWCRAWTRKISRSFATALAFTVLSPACLLIGAIRVDTDGPFNPRRLYSIFAWGDAPHVAALTLLPLAMMGLHAAVERRGPKFFALGAISLALIPLVNWPAALAMGLAVIAYLLTAPRADMPRVAARILLLAVASYALASPWLPPSTLAQTFVNAPLAQASEGTFEPAKMGAAGFVLLAGAVAGAVAASRAWLRTAYARFTLIWLAMLSAIVLGWYWGGITVVPQPYRFHLEFELALLMAAVPAASSFLEGRISPKPVWGVAAAVCGLLLIHQGAYVRQKIFPIDITEKIEYKMARWFNEHMSGRRVFAPGSAAIWMNLWSDVPQWGGCCDQSTVSSTDRTGQYYVRAGGKGEWFAGQWATIWLRAYGVYAVGVSGSRGRTHYRYFERPHLFDGVLTEVWRDGDDFIVAVPHRSGAMARVVEAADIVQQAPRTGDDLKQVAAYVFALENPRLPLAEAEWKDAHTLASRAYLSPGQVLSYHVTYHPGWRATANGKAVEVHGDALGQIYVEPACSGKCDVELVFGDGSEPKATRAAAGGCALAMLVACAAQLRRSRGQAGRLPLTS